MKVGCAAVFQNQELLKRLPNESSIYGAEVIAIDLAINIIANHKSSKFIIYSDPKSVLQALQSKNSSTPLITRLLDKMNTLSKNNSIILIWIPSHIGIQRNERANRTEKKALQTHISNTKISYTDQKPLTNLYSRNGKNLGMIKHRTNSTIFKIPSVNGQLVIEEIEKKK